MVYSIQDFLYQLESFGIYDYMLPFLLVFAIVFGILTYMRIFGDNKGVHVIIAFVIGLLAINTRWGFDFTRFYTEIFPRLGIGVSVILVLMILVGMFIPQDERRFWLWGLGAVGVFVFIVVLIKTFGNLGWDYGGYFSGYTVGWVAGAILIIGLIIAIAASGGPPGGGRGHHQAPDQHATLSGFWEPRARGNVKGDKKCQLMFQGFRILHRF